MWVGSFVLSPVLVPVCLPLVLGVAVLRFLDVSAALSEAVDEGGSVTLADAESEAGRRS